MFVTVKYGSDCSQLVNANCRNELLLKHLKHSCRLDMDETVDLSDEQGFVKNLRNSPYEYAVDYLKERESLVLLRVEAGSAEDSDSESPDRPIFIPLLRSLRDNREFLDNLNPPTDNPLERPDSKNSRGRKAMMKARFVGRRNESGTNSTGRNSGNRK